MHYVTSDIHGRYDKYLALLREIDFKPEDTLYILGDSLDRGPDGIRVLLDAVDRPNVVHLLGNHELVAALCLPWLLEEVTDANTDEKALMERLSVINDWRADGGDATMSELRRLPPETRSVLLDELRELDVWAEVAVRGRDFVLVHAGLGGFSPDRALDDYALEELVIGRPGPDETYYEDKTVIFGHTPTPYLFDEERGEISSDAKIYRRGNLIGVDCGCVFGGRLACLCLETDEEFYV